MAVGGAVRPDLRQDARAFHPAVWCGNDVVHGTGMGCWRLALAAGAATAMADGLRPDPFLLHLVRRHSVLLCCYRHGRTAAGQVARTHAAQGRDHGLCGRGPRSEEHTSELQSLMRSSYAVFCLKNQNEYKNI